MIVKRNNKWVLLSKGGKKKLGEFRTKKEAQERERQILFFKRKNARKS